MPGGWTRKTLRVDLTAGSWSVEPTREGWCHAHVQAIIVAIDQYAEAALGNRSYFLNKQYGVGGSRSDNVP